MTAPAWRIEFHRAAVRELRRLGADGESRVPPPLKRRNLPELRFE